MQINSLEDCVLRTKKYASGESGDILFPQTLKEDWTGTYVRYQYARKDYLTFIPSFGFHKGGNTGRANALWIIPPSGILVDNP